VCLNNHDFDDPPCPILEDCIDKLYVTYGGTIPYEQLVNCSGAPPMHLSVQLSYDPNANKLDAKIYPISKTCFGIPLPLTFKEGECASTFALSKKCGIPGASLSWA
jgi:hypothetical protein